MLRLSLATLLGLAAAALVAWRLGGTAGTGVLAGFTLGAGMSGLGALYQRHQLRVRPDRVLAATAVSFLAKLVALLVGALAFRYVDAAAARADWRAFLVAFAAAVVVVLPLGVLDAVRGSQTPPGSRGRSGGDGRRERTPEQMEPKEA